MEPILFSIEDTDSYYDHMCVVVKRIQPALVRERYYNRDAKYNFSSNFADAFDEQLEHLTKLRMTQEEFDFKRKAQPWLPLDYLLWKRDSFRFKREYVKFSLDSGKLDLSIEGPEDEVLHYETPLLSIITRLNHLNFVNMRYDDFEPNWKSWLQTDYDQMYNNGVNWIDFGTRRRASYETEDYACALGKQYEATSLHDGFRGTANVHFAMKHGLKVFGTYPHKYVQYMMALYGPRICNERAMYHWADTYKGMLGIALTDTTTTPVFLREFNYEYAKRFDGVRQDSGDPQKVAEMVIAHYEKLGIDPTTKILVFSDGLDPAKASLLTNKFKGRIKVTCGIGTRLTHNVSSRRGPMNHVIKASEFNFGDRWIGVVKLSDVTTKAVGTPEDVAVVKHECGIEKLRLDALSKLTSEEKELLGV